MKKILLCLIITMLMILPLILSSCGNDKTAEEIANEHFQKADKALTLSVWLPVPSSVYETEETNNKFNERLTAVEDAINDYLRSQNYCTVLDFCVFNEDVYYTELGKKFNENKAFNEDPANKNKNAHLVAEDYVNTAKLNPQTQIYEMAYPGILPNQLDIFFVGGYENYKNYVDNGHVYALDKFFTDGQSYNSLFKSIRSTFMDATKINNSYYAVPNNHVYSEQGQYILVKKDLYDAHSDKKWDNAFNLYSLQSYIEKIGDANISGVVPFVGTAETIPGIIYIDKDNLIATSLYNKTLAGEVIYEGSYLPNMTEFKDYMSFYLGLSQKSYASNKLEGNNVAAVQMYNGNLLDVANINDYYVIETIPPYASIDTLYSSMFAISSYSANYQRAMQILCLLQDNHEIRTLLQYGIEEVDYDIGEVNGEKVIYTKNSGYKMDMKYTGNCYRTFPASGVPMSAWEDIKNYNLITKLDPYLSKKITVVTGNLSDENKKLLNEYLKELGTANANVLSDFGKMNFDEYNKIATWLDEIEPIVVEAQEAIATNQKNYEIQKAILEDENSSVTQKATAKTYMKKFLENIEKNQAILDEHAEYVEFASNYGSLLDVIGLEVNNELAKLYNKIK